MRVWHVLQLGETVLMGWLFIFSGRNSPFPCISLGLNFIQSAR
jgi:hypothetical protein